LKNTLPVKEHVINKNTIYYLMLKLSSRTGIFATLTYTLTYISQKFSESMDHIKNSKHHIHDKCVKFNFHLKNPEYINITSE